MHFRPLFPLFFDLLISHGQKWAYFRPVQSGFVFTNKIARG